MPLPCPRLPRSYLPSVAAAEGCGPPRHTGRLHRLSRPDAPLTPSAPPHTHSLIQARPTTNEPSSTAWSTGVAGVRGIGATRGRPRAARQARAHAEWRRPWPSVRPQGSDGRRQVVISCHAEPISYRHVPPASPSASPCLSQAARPHHGQRQLPAPALARRLALGLGLPPLPLRLTARSPRPAPPGPPTPRRLPPALRPTACPWPRRPGPGNVHPPRPRRPHATAAASHVPPVRHVDSYDRVRDTQLDACTQRCRSDCCHVSLPSSCHAFGRHWAHQDGTAAAATKVGAEGVCELMMPEVQGRQGGAVVRVGSGAVSDAATAGAEQQVRPAKSTAPWIRASPPANRPVPLCRCVAVAE